MVISTNDRAFLSAMKKTRQRAHHAGRTVGAKDRKRRKNSRYHWSPEDLADKFEARYHIWQLSGCWIWMGATTRGYGYMVYASRQDNGGKSPRIQAHRLSWLIHRGLLHRGDLVGHTCGRKLCVNPAHLYKWRR